MRYKKTFKLFLESVVDARRPYYSSKIFDDYKTDSPKLKSKVKNQILSGIRELNSIATVKHYQLIGSILTKQYRDDADLDINVVFEVPENERDSKYAELVAAGRGLNGHTVLGSKHPINYYIVIDPEKEQFALARADNVYDIKTDQFIKRDLKNLEDLSHTYLEKFKLQIQQIDIMKNKFKRDLVDYREYKSLDRDCMTSLCSLLESQLKILEDDINAMIDKEEDIVARRKASFARDLSMEELERYGSYNRLPDNILYKLLEKYQYINFINHLKKVIGDDRILTHDEADQL